MERMISPPSNLVSIWFGKITNPLLEYLGDFLPVLVRVSEPIERTTYVVLEVLASIFVASNETYEIGRKDVISNL